MSEPSIVPYVKTTPKPFGVDVKWKWPGGCAVLELQCLHEDGRLVKERIFWPATVHLISGLKTGERVQVRLRPIAEDGSARDWRAGDWVEGVSSVDAGEIVGALDHEIRNSDAFKVLKDGWSFEKNGTLIINNGQVFINDAKIGGGVLSTNYSVKMNVDYGGKRYAAGMSIGQPSEPQATVKADHFKVQEAASSIIENAIATSAKTKFRLGDEMKQAVIDAVRESDLLASLQANIDAQTASVAGLQQAMHDAVKDVLRNALKPGGLLYKR
ncbi:phage tail tip fiber protein [Enterobacter mori]|uniref:DUF1983 domain-containing protein n=1 Tax=Enterobacter intestinihominis TaxID=3133180 RepID=A0ABV1ZLB3_9ENTR|nr:DUF1983 domain-containing protein [Enterobacter hormaechei]MBU5620835.1 DUF1983 domain-containing protein [Enterobacteriaceae bacterium S5_ASV_15]EKY3910787.1 DUF1983 domain-containing protein [Enterobacter hormaechei]ESL87786.1 hypothetical protein L422_00616 [Enterobacter hormaechei]MBK4254074.1 DUF1983 domain-containing protein [Enterobacter hormaechei]MBK4443861.1 DUF1983 domain-containing protein [Enterobacter hormaechei]